MKPQNHTLNALEDPDSAVAGEGGKVPAVGADRERRRRQVVLGEFVQVRVGLVAESDVVGKLVVAARARPVLHDRLFIHRHHAIVNVVVLEFENRADKKRYTVSGRTSKRRTGCRWRQSRLFSGTLSPRPS